MQPPPALYITHRLTGNTVLRTALVLHEFSLCKETGSRGSEALLLSGFPPMGGEPVASTLSSVKGRPSDSYISLGV